MGAYFGAHDAAPQITSRLLVLMTAIHCRRPLSGIHEVRENSAAPFQVLCQRSLKAEPAGWQRRFKKEHSPRQGLKGCRLPPRKGNQMVQRTSHDHRTSIPRAEEAKNVSREWVDRKLKLQPIEQVSDKSTAINNWLNSKVCGKAC